MAADVGFHEINGTSGSHAITENINNINFGNTDAANITPATYPIKVSENSYGKYIVPVFSGSFTLIDNVKFHKSAGDYVTDELIKFNGNVAYATPSASDTGDSNIPTTEPASNVICDLAAAGSGSIMRFQDQTGASSPTGAVNQKTLMLTYDEQ